MFDVFEVLNTEWEKTEAAAPADKAQNEAQGPLETTCARVGGSKSFMFTVAAYHLDWLLVISRSFLIGINDLHQTIKHFNGKP